MSKSRGNVVNPDEIIADYGADSLRLYEMFIGDFEKSAPWNSAGIKGCSHFLERYWNLQNMIENSDSVRESMLSVFHKTIKKVTEDIEALKFNTAIASMMTLINEIYSSKSITKKELEIFTLILNPFAPHITEEMWELTHEGPVPKTESSPAILGSCGKWPKHVEAHCKEAFVEIALQVNGKIRAKLKIPTSMPEEEVKALAKREEKISKAIEDRQILNEIYVKGRLFNIVAK
jgi:leucyl-tRNA synthetase